MKALPALPVRRISATLLTLLFASFVSAQSPAKLDPPVKPTVTGKFTGNGKSAAIKFVTVAEHEPFNDKEAISLIFTEKDPAAVKKPSFDAMFGKLGSALILSVFYDGGIFGCEVSHSAHAKRGFSSLGTIQMTEFKTEGGNVTGHVTTGKELDTFGEKWEVDLTFAAPLPEKLRNSAAKPPTERPAVDSKTSNTKTDRAEPEVQTKAASGPLISVKKVPLPQDASNVEYKSAVQQIHCTSARPVDAVAREFSTSLNQQGWKEGAGSLMGKQNAILKREQGAAKLTIMVQPAPTGSVVKIFAEGIDWNGAASTAPAKKPAAEPDADDVEAEVNKALKDALKSLPKGL